MAARPPALLVLADGSVYRGRAFGAVGEKAGEVVFNTSMTGYQEIATDPSYAGQIVCMTSPQIGNTGVNADDPEATHPWIEGLVIRELSPTVSSFRATDDLHDYLAKAGVVGIEGGDTHRLVRRLRVDGAANGAVSSADLDDDGLREKARRVPDMNGLDLVKTVTPRESFEWTKGYDAFPSRPPASGVRRHRVVAVDYGMKRNILRSLVASGFDPIVVPARESAKAILERKPAGVFLSNGPGDPAAV